MPEISILNWLDGSMSGIFFAGSLKGLKNREDVAWISLYQAMAVRQEFLAKNVTTSCDKDTPNNIVATGAPAVWNDYNALGKGVTVCILDALPFFHWQFKNRLSLADGGNEMHPNQISQKHHATAVAGIIGGGSFGMAPECELLALEVDGSSHCARLGVARAVRMRADVVCLPDGFARSIDGSTQWRRLCERAGAFGTILVTAAGNKGEEATDGPTYEIPDNVLSPGDCPSPLQTKNLAYGQRPASVITVGSVYISANTPSSTSTMQAETASSKGPVEWNYSIGNTKYDDFPYSKSKPSSGLPKPDLLAPGSGTRSCFRENACSSFGGTSAAAAHVAGAIALILSAGRPQKPYPETHKVITALQSQSDSSKPSTAIGFLQIDKAFKYGRDNKWW